MNPRVLVSTLLVSIAACGLLPAANAQQADTTASSSALTVRTVQPQVMQWAESVPASGWLKAWHEAQIEAEIGGYRITDVLVDVGSVVTKGQELAHLSQDAVLADLHKQEAAVAKATADLAKAKTDADRARQVTGTGALSAQQINEYIITEQTAQATLDSEKAALDSEQIKLSQTVIRAVDDGMISSRSATLGAVVSSGTELFRLIRQQRVEWQAEVAARDLLNVHAGLGAHIDVPNGTKIEGRVRLVSPTVDTDTGRSVIYVELPVDNIARVGLFASGGIDLATTPALTVPETALVFRDGLNYVFTVDGNRKANRILVEIGRRQQDRVEIVSGLAADANVIESGGAFLSDGVEVDVENSGK
ncbi:efflux RND transporter periplasmic adaptor subunit [Pleomorphomonas sp. PLEO]|uniref:efflux RND transporter periplasmic adaptor subunit n=1 Tax=Pleomorphomonas sp. PLEO TaxID=3239306 RepID=UPI00351E84F8